MIVSKVPTECCTFSSVSTRSGLVTTHDLALAGLADRLDAENGQCPLRRALRRRPGRATHGNALALMKAVGLDVSAPDDPQH